MLVPRVVQAVILVIGHITKPLSTRAPITPKLQPALVFDSRIFHIFFQLVECAGD